jgi:hypothetical protein
MTIMLSCNGLILNYADILYDKSKSKIQIVQEIADELPVAPVICKAVVDRIVFPSEQKQTRAGQISDSLTAGN